ncbi:hypothetical protein VW35_13825 [Devosia soli]|uniref:Uncharacterized protein n=1 Tax=Devosia soli TaxID=361041 RepID=A0A0F5L5W1_9HYPH|nr:hypothetical protein VW35_13825 [Devosia soli]
MDRNAGERIAVDVEALVISATGFAARVLRIDQFNAAAIGAEIMAGLDIENVLAQLLGELAVHVGQWIAEEQHLVEPHLHERHDLVTRALRHDADDRRKAAQIVFGRAEATQDPLLGGIGQEAMDDAEDQPLAWDIHVRRIGSDGAEAEPSCQIAKRRGFDGARRKCNCQAGRKYSLGIAFYHTLPPKSAVILRRGYTDTFINLR